MSTIKCKECNRLFKNEHGMHIHYNAMHSKKLKSVSTRKDIISVWKTQNGYAIRTYHNIEPLNYTEYDDIESIFNDIRKVMNEVKTEGVGKYV